MAVVLDPPLDPTDPTPRVDPGPPVGTANSGGATVEFSGSTPIFTVLDSSANAEQLVLGDLFLNSGNTYTLEEFSCPPPRKRAEWVAGGDSDGSALVRDPLYDNREITVKLRIAAASMDGALKAIADLSARLERAEQSPLELLWMPSGATNFLTFYVLSGEITDLPISIDSGWLFGSPIVSLTLTCKPFGYGEWRTTARNSLTGIMAPVVLVEDNVAGDVPAEAEITLTDTGNKAARHVEWGAENVPVGTAAVNTSPIVDASAMTGKVGSTSTSGGGIYSSRYLDGTSGQMAGETGKLTLGGSYRVRARVACNSGKILNAQVGVRSENGPIIKSSPVAVTPSRLWVEADIGMITVPEGWGGCYVSIWGVDYLDMITLIPVDLGYGRATAKFDPTIQQVLASDDFESAAIGSLLGARANWTTISGSGTDWTVAAHPITGSRAIRQNSIGSRYIMRTDISQAPDSSVEAEVYFANNGSISLMSHYVDASNHIQADVEAGFKSVVLSVRVGGFSWGATKAVPGLNPQGGYYRINVTTYRTGRAVMRVTDLTSGVIVAELSVLQAALATGGALNTGQPRAGLNNNTASASDVYVDNFTVGTPVPEAVAIGPSQTSRIDHQSAYRVVSAAEQLPIDIYRGARLFLPPTSVTGQAVRVVVKASQENIEDYVSDTNATGGVRISLRHRPRYLVVPYEA